MKESKIETKDLPKFDVAYEGSEYTIYQSAQTYNNGDFDYYLFIGIFDMDAIEETSKGEKYHAEIQVVKALKDLPQDVKDDVAETSCVELDELTPLDIHQFGHMATVWKDKGPNRRNLLREAREQTIPLVGLLGFYLDRPVNMLGQTGWQALDGKLGFDHPYPKPFPPENKK